MDKYAINFKASMEGIKDLFGSSTFSRGIMVGLGIGAVQIFIDAVHKLVTEQYHIYKSKEYFEKMMKEHPQLKQFPPKEVAKYFNSLNHFAPNVAKDPLAAGAYLTQSLKKLSSEELGGPPPDTFNTLADIEKKVSDAKNGSRKASTVYDKVTGSMISSAFNPQI